MKKLMEQMAEELSAAFEKSGYANWQWYLVKTADKKSWEIINWGY